MKEKYFGQLNEELHSFNGPYRDEKISLASELLIIGSKWADNTVMSSNISNNDKKKNIRKYKAECKQFILDNYKNNVHGSLSGVVFFFVFRWVLSWVIKKLVDDYVLTLEE